MKKWLALALVGSLAMTATTACSGDAGNTGTKDQIPSVLGPGEKADDFRSETAQEYYVKGQSTITLGSQFADQGEDARLQRVRELIPYKQVVIGWFLNQYLVDKEKEQGNHDYGGFKALTKNGSYEDLNIQKVDGLTYSFDFVQEVGGKLDLVDSLAQKADATPNDDGSWTFKLAVGKVSNSQMTQLTTNYEWYRSSPWSEFSPDNVDESRYEWIKLRISPEKRSSDAWIDYNRLYADGTVNVGLFFGWDYHDDFHLKHSKSIYQWLVQQGFKSPVDKWEDYAKTRQPLTRTISTPKGEVKVAVTLWWGQPGTETDPDTNSGGRVLEDAMRKSLEQNEVTLYSGHSGPFYGFALANWNKTYEGDLDDSEIPTLDMPKDKYQIVVAEGCDTYALGQAFWENPNKADRQSLDIITTTSFSNAGTDASARDILTALIGGKSGKVKATKYSELLSGLDNNSYWFQTMYGVHGIDNDPHAQPFANKEALCMECSSDADCGGAGNTCANLQGTNVCTYECTDDDGCPDGYTCRDTRTGSWLSKKVCVPASLSCDQPTTDGGNGDAQTGVQISELLADPAPDAAGDANGDGVRDARQDEFVELHNTSQTDVDLSGWSLSDNVSVRFTFPAGATVPAGGHAVVFGGGDAASFTGLGDAAVFVAKEGLFLNNGGDAVTLADHDGNKIDAVSYGKEGGQNTALVRHGDSLTQAEPTPGR